MKKQLILIGLLMFFITAPSINGQDPLLIDPSKIDSLQQLIQVQNKNSKEKIQLLNEYARLCFYNQEFKKGFEATVHARDLSREINFKGGEMMYYQSLAAFHGRREMYTYRLQQAINSIEDTENQFSNYILELKVPSNYPQNNHKKTIDKLLREKEYYSKLDEKEIQLSITNQLAWNYFNSGNMEETKASLKEIIKLSVTLNELYPHLVGTNYLTLLLKGEGNIKEAQVIRKQSIDLLSKGSNTSESKYLNFVQANHYNSSGQYALAIDYYLKSAEIFESHGNYLMLIQTYSQLGYAYETLEMQGKAADLYEKYISVFRKIKDNAGLQNAYNRPVFPLYELKRYEDARYYMNRALEGADEQDKPFLEAKKNSLEGQILMDEGKYEEAIQFLHKTYQLYAERSNVIVSNATISFTLLYLSQCYVQLNDFNNALKYALEGLERENNSQINRTLLKRRISFLISEIYLEMKQPEKGLEYLNIYKEIITEDNKSQAANRVASAEIRSLMAKSEAQIDLLEKEKTKKEQKAKIQNVWIFSMSGAFISTVIISLILYRNNKNKQKAHGILKKQKEKITNSLDKLKATQSQLIQSEKMASLGELTAGIAHEIQNPLNFVNNFSEVSEELLDELAEEIKDHSKPDLDEIVSDLKQNLGKISHHGNRASSIVKGMLDHSRTSSGEKVLTDMNIIADEYLRLSYHGLRAKDKTFNANFVTNFDKNISKVPIVPQDFGRVILNLINNAFYAVNKKGKEHSEDYEPTVTVSTKEVGNTVFISIRDNGDGIPKGIIDKIFQPFFTTKPTGEGTGLGLSLAYDIVTKEHGGQLTVTSKKGFYTKFTIELPTLKNKQL